jgi:hypothetical protein
VLLKPQRAAILRTASRPPNSLPEAGSPRSEWAMPHTALPLHRRQEGTRDVVLLFRKVLDSSASGLGSARAELNARADALSKDLPGVEIAIWR